METRPFMKIALIYAYKTRNAEEFGIDPNKVNLAYQVDQHYSPHQCDWGKDLTPHALRVFKEQEGTVKVVRSERDLVIPLPEDKILVPVTPELLKEWGLVGLID